MIHLIPAILAIIALIALIISMTYIVVKIDGEENDIWYSKIKKK